MTSAYPLSWPLSWKRTPASRRQQPRFTKKAAADSPAGSYEFSRPLTIYEAQRRVLEALARMGVRRADCIISTNVRTRADGLPRSGERPPDDPGVAVYWRDRGAWHVMPIDHYTTVAGNIAAVAATLDAMRAIERHGGAPVLERAYSGFSALPPPSAAPRGWREVLGLREGDGIEEARRAYRRAAMEAHPDRGGSDDAMAAVSAAWAEAQQALDF